jgi:hypothetical protein
MRIKDFLGHLLVLVIDSIGKWYQMSLFQISVKVFMVEQVPSQLLSHSIHTFSSGFIRKVKISGNISAHLGTWVFFEFLFLSWVK